jgi:hypothetical protein
MPPAVAAHREQIELAVVAPEPLIGALNRRLMQQRYVLANPFAGLKVRGGLQDAGLAASRALSDAEWSMVQTIAEGLEWFYKWEPAAAQRMRFVLDFAYPSGLRAGKLVQARHDRRRCQG